MRHPDYGRMGLQQTLECVQRELAHQDRKRSFAKDGRLRETKPVPVPLGLLRAVERALVERNT